MKTLFTYNNEKYEVDEFGRLWKVTGNIKSLVVYLDKELEEKASLLGYKKNPLDNLIDASFHNAAMRKNRAGSGMLQ